ncbi:hypothetical protein MPSI1_003551 [Malassezia psittaci]|uniref:PIG-P domain-containing protein n=1 Tax=Malassezia psittaci TaxID=1821823 RepID=A0AAF0JFY3_9BASI|nr:hypothetical protein MPSI1_003551 [Malassezia psittaci]
MHIIQDGQEKEVASDVSFYRRSNAEREAYGFVLYISASVLWVVINLWAVLPEAVLLAMGIEWFPRREWAYLLVAWSLVLVLTTYLCFGALNMYNTPSIDSIHCITDDHAIIYPALSTDPLPTMSIPETGWADSPLCGDMYDLSPGIVSRALYLND